MERISRLESNIKALTAKIAQLYQTFPFNIKELIFDEKYITRKQNELQHDIEKFEQERVKYLNIINIMIDE